MITVMITTMITMISIMITVITMITLITMITVMTPTHYQTKLTFITSGFVEPFIARDHVGPFIVPYLLIHPAQSAMILVTRVPHGTKKCWPRSPLFIQLRIESLF